MTNNKNSDTNTEKNKKDFPGYPHYPAREDILNQPDAERVDLDVENLSRSKKHTLSELSDNILKDPAVDEQLPVDDDEIVPGTDADVTEDDLFALEERDVDTAKVDLLEGEEDLDVPGSEADDDNEEIGEEDEENNYYSLGGDDHENLEEDQA